MPTRNAIISIEQPTPLRRSPRLRDRQASKESDNSKLQKPRSRTNGVRLSPELSLSSTRETTMQKPLEDPVKKPSNGSRKSPRLNKAAEGVLILRRSPRFSNKVSSESKIEKCRDDLSKKSIKCVSNRSRAKGVLPKIGEGEVAEDLCEQLVEKRERRTEANYLTQQGEVAEDLCEQLVEKRERRTRGNDLTQEGEVSANVNKGSKCGMKRKRNQRDVDNVLTRGWTKEQEMALERAYFTAKPTPHFWKKVSKMVPGKSAQDCFDKINSGILTPLSKPRSRAKRTDAPSVGNLSLSANKVLKFTKTRCNANRRKGCAQKTARHLLKQQYRKGQEKEVDLFRVLEPDLDKTFPVGAIQSTPIHFQNQGILQKCFKKSSSGHKKLYSRYNSSCGSTLVSPPVLKQVKNRVLHEKYIDRLHSREAKRRAASTRARKSMTKEVSKETCCQNIVDTVRAAKIALVSDATDAIRQIQCLQASSISNSSDYDDDSESQWIDV